MNEKELFIINESIDGKDLPLLDLPRLNKSAARQVRESMVSKGYLKNPQEFSEDAERLVRRLRRYKEAPKVVRIEDTVYAPLDQGKCVAIRQDSSGDYEILFGEYPDALVALMAAGGL